MSRCLHIGSPDRVQAQGYDGLHTTLAMSFNVDERCKTQVSDPSAEQYPVVNSIHQRDPSPQPQDSLVPLRATRAPSMSRRPAKENAPFSFFGGLCARQGRKLSDRSLECPQSLADRLLLACLLARARAPGMPQWIPPSLEFC